MPAAAEIFVALAACVLLLVEATLGARGRNAAFLLAIAALAGAAWVTSEVAVAGAHGGPERPLRRGPDGHGAEALRVRRGRGHAPVLARLPRAARAPEGRVPRARALRGARHPGHRVGRAACSTLYLGIEIMSLSLYAMVAFDRDDGIAAESAMKYFVLGAIASGALLYGISIIYGVTGSLLLDGIAAAVGRDDPPAIGLLFGLAFIVVGVAFKFGAVPFHMWLPDVYHGAPTPVTLFVGSAPKIASFALAMRAARRGTRRRLRRLAGHADRAGGAVDDRRQRGRDRADEHQAHAGVLDDLARRFHPARRAGRRMPAATAPRCSTR